MHGGLLNFSLLQGTDHSRNLGLGEHEIAHGHCPARADSLERDPGSERERRPDFHSVERYIEIAPRKAVLHGAISLQRAWPTDSACYG